jgi:hypothetical protein
MKSRFTFRFTPPDGSTYIDPYNGRSFQLNAVQYLFDDKEVVREDWVALHMFLTAGGEIETNADSDYGLDIMGAGLAAKKYTREAAQRVADRIQLAREVVEAARKTRAAFINQSDPNGPLAELWKALEAHDAVGR